MGGVSRDQRVAPRTERGIAFTAPRPFDRATDCDVGGKIVAFRAFAWKDRAEPVRTLNFGMLALSV
jgi:hypothetical protein